MIVIAIIGGNMSTNLSYIFASLFGHSISANVILKTLKEFGLGVRRQDFLRENRKVRNIEFDGEKSKILFTPNKYLTEEQKDKKYWLLYDKMRDKAYRREQREKRKAVKEFMKTDAIDVDSTLTPTEKIEDVYNERRRFMKYEM